MTVSRDKYIEVHERAVAEEVNAIGMRFLTRVNEYLDDIKQRLGDNRIGTPEDAIECELTNNWYKALVPFISQMQLNTSSARESFFKEDFNGSAKPRYTADDFVTLQMAQESASTKIYSSIMATADRIHERLVAQALDKAEHLGRNKDAVEGSPDEDYKREVAQRFLARLDGLMLELHDMVLPDLSDGPGGEDQGRKRPPQDPKGKGPRF